jgi:hypothetical protein
VSTQCLHLKEVNESTGLSKIFRSNNDRVIDEFRLLCSKELCDLCAHVLLVESEVCEFTIGRRVAKMEETRHAHRNLIGSQSAKYSLGRLVSIRKTRSHLEMIHTPSRHPVRFTL